MKQFKWATLQSLNGGMSIGFESKFGEPVYHIKNNESHDIYYETYCKQRNFKTKVINTNWDLTEFVNDSDADLFNELLDANIDVVSYVPICSGLSMLNCQTKTSSLKARGDANNDQNKNMYNTTNFILEKIQPKVCVFENAPGAYTKLGENVIKVLRGIASLHGYSMSLEKTNTILHGIPQKRSRTFIYFWKSKNAPILEYEFIEPPTLEEYLKLIPSDAKGQDVFINNDQYIKDAVYDFLKSKYKFNKLHEFIQSIGGKTMSVNQILEKLDLHDEAIEFLEKSDYEKKDIEIRTVKKNQRKLADNKGYWDSSTVVFNDNKSTNAIISKNMFRIVHPTDERPLNLREFLWLMGMPHDYWMEDLPKSYPQITQSVPVAPAKHVADNCYKYLSGKLLSSNSAFVKQSNEHCRIDLKTSISQDDASISSFF